MEIIYESWDEEDSTHCQPPLKPDNQAQFQGVIDMVHLVSLLAVQFVVAGNGHLMAMTGQKGEAGINGLAFLATTLLMARLQGRFTRKVLMNSGFLLSALANCSFGQLFLEDISLRTIGVLCSLA